jgi:hypothetical protein
LLNLVLTACVLAGSAAEPRLQDLAPGWEQVEIEAYHGPEGYYHDSVSGAVVRYYTGVIPDYHGVRPRSGVPCVVSRPAQESVPCLLADSPKNLQVFIGPYDQRVYASYWIPRGSPQQESRGLALAYSNPLAVRVASGHQYLDRDPREDDLGSLRAGQPIVEVLRALGDPLRMKATAGGGFSAEYIIWGNRPSRSGKRNWASRTVTLEFSRERALLRVPRAAQQ